MWKAWTDTLNEGYADHFHPKSTPKIVKQQQQKHPDKKKSMEVKEKSKETLTQRDQNSRIERRQMQNKHLGQKL